MAIIPKNKAHNNVQAYLESYIIFIENVMQFLAEFHTKSGTSVTLRTMLLLLKIKAYPVLGHSLDQWPPRPHLFNTHCVLIIRSRKYVNLVMTNLKLCNKIHCQVILLY